MLKCVWLVFRLGKGYLEEFLLQDTLQTKVHSSWVQKFCIILKLLFHILGTHPTLVLTFLFFNSFITNVDFFRACQTCQVLLIKITQSYIEKNQGSVLCMIV
jgi:hypothetical protein